MFCFLYRFLKLLVFILSLAFLALLPLKAVSKINISKVDVELLDFFKDECSKLKVYPNAFPDYYFSRQNLNNCDIAHAFDPQNFAFNYHFLKLANFQTVSVIREFDESMRIVERHFGIEVDKEELSDLEKALKGDILAYHALVADKSLSPLFGNLGIDPRTVDQLGNHFDPIITELLFLNDIELSAKTSEKRLLELTDHLLREANHISREQIFHATWRLNEQIIHYYVQKGLSVAHQIALKMPHQLRMNLLALKSISEDGLDQDLIRAIRLIEYSPHEIFGHFAIGTTENFYSNSLKNFDDYFVMCSQSVIDAYTGSLSLEEPSFAIECLHDLRQANKSYFERYRKIANNKVIDFVIELDLEAYNRWESKFSEKLLNQTPNEDFEYLYALDLRFNLNSILPQERHDAQKLLEDLPFEMHSMVHTFPNMLLKIAQLVETKDEKLYETNVQHAVRLLTSIVQENDICSNIDQTVCHKNIRMIASKLEDQGFKPHIMHSLDGDLSVALKRAQKVLKNERRVETHSCRLTEWKRKFLKLSFEAGSFDRNVLRWCNSVDLKNIFDNKSNNLSITEIVTRAGGFPSAPAINFLNNLNLWNVEELGLIFLHINNSTPFRELIQFPEQGVGEFAKTLPVYQWLLRNKSTEEYLFNTYDGNYWENVKPLNALADLYIAKGKYELAYLAQGKKIEKDLSAQFDNETNLLLPIYLSRLKYIGKKAVIPNHFLDESIRKYSANMKWHSENSLSDVADELLSKLSAPGSNKLTLQSQLGFAYKYLEDYAKADGQFEISRIINMSEEEIRQFCGIKQNLEQSIHLAERVIDEDLSLIMRSLGGDGIFIEELWRYLSFCMLGKDKVLSYEELVSKFLLPQLRKSADIFQPGLLPIMLLISDTANRSHSLLGTYITLVYSKHYFSDLGFSFVNNKSAALREKQKDFEYLIGNAAKNLSKVEIEKHPNLELIRINFTLHKLAASFHFPLLTYKSMRRMVDEHSLFTQIETNGVGQLETVRRDRGVFDNLLKHYKAIDEQIASAKDPNELIMAKSAYSNSNIQAIPNVLAIGDVLENAVLNFASNPSDDKVQVNLIASDTSIYIQAFSGKLGFSSQVFDINMEVIREIRTVFAGGKLGEETIQLACNTFEPIRSYLAKLLPGEDSGFFLITPSVNLLPIPPGIFAGNYCDDLNSYSVFTGDVAASFEFISELENIKLPSEFIGVGNPILEVNSDLEKIFAENEIFRGTSDQRRLDLSMLPALPDATNEIIEISNLFPNSVLYLNENASINDALSKAEILSKKSDGTVINLATHAFSVDYAGDINLPAMLTSENYKLEFITANEIGVFELPGSIVLLSACDTATGYIQRLDLYLTGFVENFANAGAKLILATLWPVNSIAAKDHSIDFLNLFSSNGLNDAIKGVQNADKAKINSPFIMIYP